MFTILSAADGTSTVTLIEDGKTYVATSDHPNYAVIVEALVKGNKAATLFNAATRAYELFNKVSTRISLTGTQLFFDNDPVEGPLAEQILRFMQEGQDFAPLVKFYEKVANNPKEHSREQLFTWLNRGAFTIDNDGDIVMYKGVNQRDDGVYTSIHSGPAIVNGVAVNGQVPQKIGDVVEMARSQVNHDPTQGCSTGLHASNFDYARSFTTGAVLTVKVNPADVVSVPTDCDAQKVRTCRYTVAGVTEYEIDEAYWADEDEDQYDIYEDEHEEGYWLNEKEDNMDTLKIGDTITTDKSKNVGVVTDIHDRSGDYYVVEYLDENGEEKFTTKHK